MVNYKSFNFDENVKLLSGVDFIIFFCALRPCANHRDSSIHLLSAPMPNFLRSYFVAQKFGVGRKTVYEIDPSRRYTVEVELTQGTRL